MPRKPRSSSDALYHHVFNRGVEKRRIFHTVADVLAFLEYLAIALAETGAKCLAWAVMKNHFHLVLASTAEILGVVMHRVLGSYATRYNSIYERAGHLFGGRFGSVPIHDDVLLKTEIRYCVRNPYEAGLVSTLDELETYPWTSYPTLFGSDGPVPVAVEQVLALFGETVDVARARLREWIKLKPARPGETGQEAAIRVIAEELCAAFGLHPENLRGRTDSFVRGVREKVVQEVRARVPTTDVVLSRVLGLSPAMLSRIPRLDE